MQFKQVIVVRKDLKMRKGKIAAQVAHAAMKILLDRSTIKVLAFDEAPSLIIPLDSPYLQEWIQGIFTKVVVSCKDEDELLDVARASEKRGFPIAVIVDSGATEFHGVPTRTCVAVGPAPVTDIDEVTGHLKLL